MEKGEILEAISVGDEELTLEKIRQTIEKVVRGIKRAKPKPYVDIIPSDMTREEYVELCKAMVRECALMYGAPTNPRRDG